MTRAALLLALLLAACDDGAPPPPAGGGGVVRPKDPPPPPPPPVTGLPQIQKETDAMRTELAKLEAQGKSDPAAIDMLRKRIDFILQATEIAIRNEARQMARERHGLLMQEQGRVLAARNQAYAELVELEKTLEAQGKGENVIPKGFTADELRKALRPFLPSGTNL